MKRTYSIPSIMEIKTQPITAVMYGTTPDPDDPDEHLKAPGRKLYI